MAKESQPDKLEALNRQLDAMIDRGMEQQRRFHGMWTDGLNYTFDNQLSGKARRKGWERISINYLWPAISKR